MARVVRSRTLAKVMSREVATSTIVELYVTRFSRIDVKVAVSRIVSVGLVILRVSQPPRTAIRGHPRALLINAGLHGVTCTSSAAVRGAGHVYDQVRLCRQRSRSCSSFPVLLTPWGPKFIARWTRILICRFGNFETIAHFE